MDPPPEDLFRFQRDRESPTDTRNVLLVVSILIGGVCFQAGMNPPTGLNPPRPPSPPSPPPPLSSITSPVSPPPPPHMPAAWVLPGAGVIFPAVLPAVTEAHNSWLLMYLFANSLGFAASASVIMYLTAGFPFRRELVAALFCMLVGYAYGVNLVLKDQDKATKNWAYILLALSNLVPYMSRSLPRLGRFAWSRWGMGTWSRGMEAWNRWKNSRASRV